MRDTPAPNDEFYLPTVDINNLLKLCEHEDVWRSVPKINMPTIMADLFEVRKTLTSADVLRSARIAKVYADNLGSLKNNPKADEMVWGTPGSREDIDERLRQIPISPEEFAAALQDIKHKEIKLAVILLINQISKAYTDLRVKMGPSFFVADLVLEDITLTELMPGSTAISFKVWTRRMLFSVPRG